jgi:hypothetical protein
MGCPSTTWVPAVTIRNGPGRSMAPAITDRAAFPVHTVSNRVGCTAGPRPSTATPSPTSSTATGDLEPDIVSAVS